MTYTVIIDVLLGGLLAATIFYTTRLYKKMAEFKLFHQDLQVLATQFSNATDTAQNAIAILKDTTVQAGGLLESHIRKAHTLKEDLNFMSDRALNATTALETSIAQARQAKNDLAMLATTITAAKKATPAVANAIPETEAVKPAKRSRASKAEAEFEAEADAKA